jgi:hypothetical protein
VNHKTPIFKWIWERCPAKNGDKLVLLRLACFSEADGTCWAAPEVLESSTGMTRRNIYRCMDRLVANGWLEVLGKRRAENGRMLCQRYRIAFKNDNLSCVSSDNLSENHDNLSFSSDNLSLIGDKLSTDNKDKEHNEEKEQSADAPAPATASPSLPSSSVKTRKPRKPADPKFDPASIPLPHGPGFQKWWLHFVEHRASPIKGRRNPLTPKAADIILGELAAVNEQQAVEAIKSCIAAGWVKPYPPKPPDKPTIVELPPQGRPKHTALEKHLAEQRRLYGKEDAA